MGPTELVNTKCRDNVMIRETVTRDGGDADGVVTFKYMEHDVIAAI